ncbi:hypothetical protein FA95DRAFT_121530 [Auriscalpium vulgare]|uniref:Uncharacterized protein n=1 Tax=Auriscalpium vulgare TaxID=40419 RepID=A0ACB8RMS3_9AGAM|nr:hypothetical protein FA95DRAFT_121530 [Auriscalpium vulgare]
MQEPCVVGIGTEVGPSRACVVRRRHDRMLSSSLGGLQIVRMGRQRRAASTAIKHQVGGGFQPVPAANIQGTFRAHADIQVPSMSVICRPQHVHRHAEKTQHICQFCSVSNHSKYTRYNRWARAPRTGQLATSVFARANDHDAICVARNQSYSSIMRNGLTLDTVHYLPVELAPLL